MQTKSMWYGAMCVLSMNLLACTGKTGSAVVASPYLLTASIQDIMKSEVDPSADYLWEAVGTTVTKQGEDKQQPHTEEQWLDARRHAITLVEATNLLVMPGRRVVGEGKEVEDAHLDVIRKASQIQADIDADIDRWVGYAHALHAASELSLRAVDARDAEKLLQAGEAVDAACEACHLKYWYPGQVIPNPDPH